MRLFAAGSALLSLLWLGGCARARVTTDIQADGSSIRTILLSGQEKTENGVPTPTLATPMLEDTFVIPSGAEWKAKEEKQSGNRALTLERTIPLGKPLGGDLSIKAGEPGKIKVVNEAKVTRAGPHRFEYRETLLWKGDPAAVLGEIKSEDLKTIKASLPKPLATDANVRALADKMAVLSIPMLFGPGDPLLAMGLLDPDLAIRRAGQRMGAVLLKALEDQFGDQMQPAQRKEVARQLIQQTFASPQFSQPRDPTAAPASNSTGLTPLMFIVKTPGRIVSSNGEVDELAGEVFWALFEEAAASNNVVLTALVEVE